MSERAEPADVTPADREVYLLIAMPHVQDDLDRWAAAQIRRGADDHQPGMQAIARHRLSGSGAAA